jgi:hypothetical protein
MSGNNNYFNTGRDIENAALAVSDAYRTVSMFDPVRDKDHQMVLDMYLDAIKVNAVTLRQTESSVGIHCVNKQSFELSPICVVESDGVLFHVIGDDDLWLVQGTMYTNSLVDTLDAYVLWQRDAFFAYDNTSGDLGISECITSPFVAAKTEIGQFGRMVFARVMLRDAFLRKVQEGSLKEDDELYTLTVQKQFGNLALSRLSGIEHLPSPIFSVETYMLKLG